MIKALRRHLKLNEKGFTLVELTTALLVAVIVSAIAASIFITFYGSVLRADVESRLVVDSQILLRNLVDELRIATAIRDTNLNDDPNEPSGGWATNLDNAILIIAIPARDSDKEFIIDPDTGAPYENEIVYFADGDILYRRTIPNAAAPGNSLGPTCPEALASSTCVADRLLSDDYQSLDFVFYDQDDVVTTNTSLAKSIEMQISLGRDIFGQQVNIDNNIRMTLRN